MATTVTESAPATLEMPDEPRMPVRDERPAPRAQLVRDAPTDELRQHDPPVHSEHIDQIVTALAAAQGKFGEIERAHTAEVSSKRTGGRYTYEYEDMAAVLTAVRGPLSEHGIALVQLPTTRRNGITLMTMLAHSSGQWIRGYLAMPCDVGDPQAIGSAISYARRYAAKAMLGLAPSEGEDDDGARATGRGAVGAPQAAQRASARREDREREERRAEPREESKDEPKKSARPEPVGTIARIAERQTGVLVQLNTGYIFAARDAEMIDSLRKVQQAGDRIEVSCQASPDPARIAPLLLEYRKV